MKKFILTFLSIILILSCSKDDTDDISNYQVLFIKQIKENGNISHKYSYINELISSREHYNNGQLYVKENFEYSNDTVIKKTYDSSNNLFDIRKYYSLSDEISRIDKFNSNHELINYKIYTFSNNTCGFISIDSYDNNDILIYKKTFEYTNSNCSMVSFRFDSNNQIIYKKEWIRDDKNQYNKNELLAFFKADNLGNTTKFYLWDSQNNINNDYSYKSTFNYNTSNYPISEQRVYLNGVTKEFEYEYY